MNAAHRIALFERLKAVNPAPATELAYATPFQLLIAVILSAQATDKSVNAATHRLFADAPDARAIRELGEERLTGYIRHIGLYRNKSKNIIATCRLLLERHGGDVPRERAALEALPGVGRKTANVVLNTAFGEPTIAVDTHIFRVANRTGLAPGKTPLAVELGLLKAVPPAYRKNAHHWLILHGRYVCKARKPECEHCVIADFCASRQDSRFRENDEATPAKPSTAKTQK
ncbi:MAG: endonuclease III [Candidatus Accumulibacter sp.]|jgi:endonuclease-3|nr:endonuclease III [Accumulibacter sp.]